MKHIIGFPGLFKDRFVVDRVAFDLGELIGSKKPIYIYWYGLIIVAAMIVAYVYFMLRAKKSEGIVEDHTMNIALLALPLGIVGARTFYVLTNLEDFDSLKQAIMSMRKGGLAIYGGIIFGLITVIVYCRIKKVNVFKLLDSLAPAVMIAQSIGRWGNFFNAEAYGSSKGVESFPFRMTIAPLGDPNKIITVHPTFLYESIWNLIGFVIANIIYRKKKVDGQIFCFYIFWYGIGRAFIEILRTDSCMILGKIIKKDPLDFFGTSSGDGLKVFIYLSIILAISGIVLYIILKKRSIKESDDISQLKTVLEAESAENESSAIVSESVESESEELQEPNNEEGGNDSYDEGEDGNDGYDNGE